jgi:hypothetical protein
MSACLSERESETGVSASVEEREGGFGLFFEREGGFQGALPAKGRFRPL